MKRTLLLTCLFAAAAALPAFESAWLLPPDKSGQALPAGADFEVGPGPSAWLLLPPRGMLRLDKGRAWRVAERVNDLQYLAGGALVLAIDRCVGTLDAERADAKKGVAPVNEAFLLPSKGFRLGQATGQSVLAYGRDLYSGKFQAYLVGPGAERKIVFQGGADADAALWHDGKLVLAYGKRVVELAVGGSPTTRALASLPQPATHLAWVQGAGLAASTAAGVFIVKSGGGLQRVHACRSCPIRSHDGHLFILNDEPVGIVRLTGLGDAR